MSDGRPRIDLMELTFCVLVLLLGGGAVVAFLLGKEGAAETLVTMAVVTGTLWIFARMHSE